MENLQRLKTETLVDMLSIQTDKYFRIQAVGASEEEFARCKLLLRAVQKEIDHRKKTGANMTQSNEEQVYE